jgi:hypothetical protein
MEIDLDTYREQSRETWAQMAPGWEARHDWMIEITGRVGRADALTHRGTKRRARICSSVCGLNSHSPFTRARRSSGSRSTP